MAPEESIEKPAKTPREIEVENHFSNPAKIEFHASIEGSFDFEKLIRKIRELAVPIYAQHPELPLPERVYFAPSWKDAMDQQDLTSKDLVVIGVHNQGLKELQYREDPAVILMSPIDFGEAVLLTSYSIIEADVSCGRHFSSGDIIRTPLDEVPYPASKWQENFNYDPIHKFYIENPTIPEYKRRFAYSVWNEIPSMPYLSPTDLVYVHSGNLNQELDLGFAIVVNNGGDINAPLTCGRYHESSRPRNHRAEINQVLTEVQIQNLAETPDAPAPFPRITERLNPQRKSIIESETEKRQDLPNPATDQAPPPKQTKPTRPKLRKDEEETEIAKNS